MTTYTDLQLVASDEEQDGLLHVGVMHDGAFYPLGAFKAGSHEQRKNVPTAQSLAPKDEDKSTSGK